MALLEDVKAGLQATLRKLSSKRELALAIRCALMRWAALTGYADDGRIEIDNSRRRRS